MKGVILAGGNGSRLMPLTKAVNKHLLPVGPYPMIYWSIMKLEEAGIKDILLISQKSICRNFINCLGTGRAWRDNHLSGSASRIGHFGWAVLCKTLYEKEPFILLLGDNIFEDSLKPLRSALNSREKEQRCC